MWPSIPSGNVASMFYPLLYPLFSDKKGNLARNHWFLLHTISKTKAPCKIPGESELQCKTTKSNLKCTIKVGYMYTLSPSILLQ